MAETMVEWKVDLTVGEMAASLVELKAVLLDVKLVELTVASMVDLKAGEMAEKMVELTVELTVE